MDRERPQTRCRHAGGLLPASPDDGYRTDDVLPHARRAVRHQRGKRLDQTSGNRSVGATGTRTPTATQELTTPQLRPNEVSEACNISHRSKQALATIVLLL